MKNRGAKEKVRCEALVVLREVEIVGDLLLSPQNSTQGEACPSWCLLRLNVPAHCTQKRAKLSAIFS